MRAEKLFGESTALKQGCYNENHVQHPTSQDTIAGLVSPAFLYSAMFREPDPKRIVCRYQMK